MLIALTGLREFEAAESRDGDLPRFGGKKGVLGPGDLETDISLASWNVAVCSSSNNSLSDRLSATLFRRVSTSMCKGSTSPRRRFARSLICFKVSSEGVGSVPLLSMLLGSLLSNAKSSLCVAASAVCGREDAVVTIAGTSVMRFSTEVEKAVSSMFWLTALVCALRVVALACSADAWVC